MSLHLEVRNDKMSLDPKLLLRADWMKRKMTPFGLLRMAKGHDLGFLALFLTEYFAATPLQVPATNRCHWKTGGELQDGEPHLPWR